MTKGSNLRTNKLKTYYRLTKPGIVYGNLIAAAGGFLLAARGHIHPVVLVAMLVGLALIIACGCVFNNYIDRGIDQRMDRTKKRALVTGEVSGRSAIIYATVLGALGTAVLAAGTNPLTTAVALFGLFAYVVIYGIGKRKTVHGTVIGSISGAVPPVVGYVAVTHKLDLGALLVFLIMTAWQMPHFYAIAIYRSKEYAAAGIPVLPVRKGVAQTRVQIVAYILLFLVASTLLRVYHYAGYVYLVLVLGLGLWWLRLALQGFKAADTDKWARKLFGASLVVMMGFSLAFAVGSVLP